MTYSAPDYSTPPESVAAPPATRPNPAVAVFGWLGLVSVLAITIGVLIGIDAIASTALLVLLVAIIGAMVAARTNRGRVTRFAALMIAAVVMWFLAATLGLGAHRSYRSGIDLAYFAFAVVVGIVGAIGVIRAGHRAPAPRRVATAPRPVGYTADGQPFYPVVGYRSDGTPVTADQAPGYAPQVVGTNTMAILAFVMAFVFTFLAVPLGHIARAQIRRTGEQGAGLALAALIIGYIWLAVVIVGAIVLIALAANGY